MEETRLLPSQVVTARNHQCEKAGYLRASTYCKYFEEARLELLLFLRRGVDNRSFLMRPGSRTVLRAQQIQIFGGVRFGQQAVVEADVIKMGSSSITMRHAVKPKGGSGEIVVATTTLVFAAQDKAISFPEEVRKLVTPHVESKKHVPRFPSAEDFIRPTAITDGSSEGTSPPNPSLFPFPAVVGYHHRQDGSFVFIVQRMVFPNDLDTNNHMNHARYLDICEEVRYLLHLHSSGEAKEQAALPLTYVGIDYRREALCGETLNVYCYPMKLKEGSPEQCNTKCWYGFDFYRQEGKDLVLLTNAILGAGVVEVPENAKL